MGSRVVLLCRGKKEYDACICYTDIISALELHFNQEAA